MAAALEGEKLMRLPMWRPHGVAPHRPHRKEVRSMAKKDKDRGKDLKKPDRKDRRNH
jgi:hypothetical protein